jgi:hypothetical protein
LIFFFFFDSRSRTGICPCFCGWSDPTNELSRQLPFIPSVVFAVLAARYGVGMHDPDIPSPLYPIRAMEYLIIWELHYFISSTIIKCGIGFQCIRLDQRRRVVYPLYINMSIILIVAVLALIFVFANCRPLAATWNPAL